MGSGLGGNAALDQHPPPPPWGRVAIHSFHAAEDLTPDVTVDVRSENSDLLLVKLVTVDDSICSRSGVNFHAPSPTPVISAGLLKHLFTQERNT